MPLYNNCYFVILFTDSAPRMDALWFYLFGGLMLGSALLVVFGRQPIYSVLSLLVAMFCLAALFVLLGAYFIAALQLLLYVGAVLVLFLFVMMLLNVERERQTGFGSLTARNLGTLIIVLLFCGELLAILARSLPPRPVAELPVPDSTVAAIGHLLFRQYLLPFELTSFLILAAIIGAVTLARSKPPES